MKKNDTIIINHEFEDPKAYFGAVNPPITQSSLFVFESFESLIEAGKNEEENFFYTRGNNPTLKIVEEKMAALEETERAKVFSSGMGAISSSIISLLKSGDHILLINHVYGTSTVLLEFFKRYGITYTQIHTKNIKDIESEIKKNTKLIYFESPSTILMEILDIEKICKLAKKNNCYTLFDNSVNTPLITKPATLGVDIVVHSLSKYIGGHSDVVAGVVCTTQEIYSEIFKIGHQCFGSVLGPQEAYLVLRGLRSLRARLNYQQSNFKEIIEFLKNSSYIKKINHPSLYKEEEKKICKKQMNGYSTLLSVELQTENLDQIKRFVNSLEVFQIGVSWGGHESLILPLYRGNNDKKMIKNKFPLSLIRIYIGQEDAQSLIEDLKLGFKNLE